MWFFLVGLASFFLFFLYDILQMTAPAKASAIIFFLGLLLLTVGTGGLLLLSWRAGPGTLSPWQCAALLGAGLSLLLLLHSLFFSLPRETYRDPSGKKPLVNTGLYALCRHPGVLFFALLYLFLWLSFGGRLLFLAAVSYALCNLLYGLMQDVWVFPRQFAGYEHYRNTTPFLLPCGSSLRACIRTWNGRNPHHRNTR